MFVEPTILSGKHILIAEDEVFVALLIEELLIDWGCVLTGTYSRLDKALKAVESVQCDLAILDVNLGGEMSYPIAEALDRRGTPFLFLSGYGSEVIPLAHPTWMACAKPFTEKELVGKLVALLTLSH